MRAAPGSCPSPQFSLPFRLGRAIRVIPVDIASQAIASNFDSEVSSIEVFVTTATTAGTITQQWQPCDDAETCAACDFATFAQVLTPHFATYFVTAPDAP